MNKSESVLKNGTHKILWDIVLETNYLIPAEETGINEQEKKTCHLEDFFE